MSHIVGGSFIIGSFLPNRSIRSALSFSVTEIPYCVRRSYLDAGLQGSFETVISADVFHHAIAHLFINFVFVYELSE